MILGVLSDTHGNRIFMGQAVELMIARFEADQLIHLGDDYDDAEILMMAYPNVWAIPGLWCQAYHNPRIPNRLVQEVDGLRIVAVHADKDLRPSDQQAHLILSGHTHEARMEWRPPGLWLNPGHLKRPTDRGQRPSFAVVRIASPQMHAAVYELDGTLRDEQTVEVQTATGIRPGD